MGKKRKLRKCRGSIREVRRTDEYRDEEIRKDRYGRGKRLQEGGISREVYGKTVI